MGFGEQVYDGDQKQRRGDQAESDGNLHATESEIQWNLKFALARTSVSGGRAPRGRSSRSSKSRRSVEVREKGDVAAADNDGDNLERHDDIDDAIAGTNFLVRLPEPRAEHAVFRNAIQHAVWNPRWPC